MYAREVCVGACRIWQGQIWWVMSPEACSASGHTCWEKLRGTYFAFSSSALRPGDLSPSILRPRAERP